MNWFFCADEHYFHKNIIKYSNRPFSSIEEMNNELIKRHNELVGKNDTTIHAGDFCFGNKATANKILSQLNGNHLMLKGSHDKWMPKNTPTRWEKTINGISIVVDHYPLRTWRKSHYGSIMAHGHSHGKLLPLENQLDIGVDTNDFYPYSFDQICNIIASKQKEK